MSNEDNPFFLMGAMLGEKSGEVTDLRRRIEELEAKLRKSALQELSALGQASEAYQAQLAAEAKLAQQDDLMQAAVAAALREAAQVARASFDGELGYDEILDLIPEGAQAALDRVVAAERENGFWVGRSCGGSKAEIDAALAAIRKGVKND